MSEITRLSTTWRCGLALLAAGWCGAAWSEAMSDPTRPAAEWLAVQPKVPGMPAADQDTSPALHMLLIGHSRKYAIIGGQMVRVGDAYNGYKLVAIKHDSVVLQENDTLQTLKMYPAITKTVIAPKPSGKTGRPASKAKAVVKGERK